MCYVFKGTAHTLSQYRTFSPNFLLPENLMVVDIQAPTTSAPVSEEKGTV